MRKRGFSLLEVMMSVALIAILLTLTMANLTKGRGKAGSNGLAMVVCEELRRTRQEAITHRRPTAFILPRAGSSRHTQAYCILEGENSPRIVRSRSFGSEFGDAVLFVGDWSLAAGSSRSTTSIPVDGSKLGGFTASVWLPTAQQNDSCFIFLPDGSVRTNDMPSVNGSYQIIVASGVTYSGSALSRSGECFTVSLSPLGSVTLTGGLLNQDGSVPTAGTFKSAGLMGQAYPVLTYDPADPVRAAGYPKVVPGVPQANPGGVDSYVTKEQFVTLEMAATSPSGDQMFCEWVQSSASPTAAGKKGSFSIIPSVTTSNAGRMEWDQSSSAWRTTWQWHPPYNALPGEIYDLEVQVQNVSNGRKSVKIKKSVKVSPPGAILYQSDRATGAGPGVYSMDVNGAREKIYVPGASQPTATMDGSRMAYILGGNVYVRVVNDPAPPTQLTFTGDCSSPALSPNGNLIAYRRGTITDPGSRLYVMKTAAGATPKLLVNSWDPSFYGSNGFDPQTEKLGWKYDGSAVLFPCNGGIYKCDVPLVGSVPNPGPATAFVNFDENGAGGAFSSVSWAPPTPLEPNDGKVYMTSNYNKGHYDPWLYVCNGNAPGTADNPYTTIGTEEVMVERCPNGGTQALTCRGVVAGTWLPPIPSRQICMISRTSAPSLQYFLTDSSNGSNINPVWTDR